MTLPILHPYRVVQLPALSLGLRRDVFHRCRRHGDGVLVAVQIQAYRPIGPHMGDLARDPAPVAAMGKGVPPL